MVSSPFGGLKAKVSPSAGLSWDAIKQLVAFKKSKMRGYPRSALGRDQQSYLVTFTNTSNCPPIVQENHCILIPPQMTPSTPITSIYLYIIKVSADKLNFPLTTLVRPGRVSFISLLVRGLRCSDADNWRSFAWGPSLLDP